ncbi:MAG: head decoration protein [Lachnospiraceae bacterium]|nr:head decoration protein [Lachnospiraceae bacterium]
MMKTELTKKVITCEPDDLIVGTYPPARVGAGVIAANAGALKRGTILAKNSAGKLDILGKDTSAKPFGVLCDDVEVGAEEATAAVYIGGKFNSNKITVNDGYTMTEDDKDTLRAYGIEFIAALKY